MFVIICIMSLTIKILFIISSNIQIKVFKTRLKYCLFVFFLGNWNTIFHTKFYRVLEHIRIILILSHVMPVPLILILHVKHDNFRIFCGLNWTFRQFFYNLGFSKPPSSAELTQIFYILSSFHSKSSLIKMDFMGTKSSLNNSLPKYKTGFSE